MKTFWEGHRANEVNAANLADNADWNKFVRMYGRFYNDGDTPNWQALNRLARLTGVEHCRFTYDRAKVLEAVGNALLDQMGKV